jgi:hypothetical protein
MNQSLLNFLDHCHKHVVEQWIPCCHIRPNLSVEANTRSPKHLSEAQSNINKCQLQDGYALHVYRERQREGEGERERERERERNKIKRTQEGEHMRHREIERERVFFVVALGSLSSRLSWVEAQYSCSRSMADSQPSIFSKCGTGVLTWSRSRQSLAALPWRTHTLNPSLALPAL